MNLNGNIKKWMAMLSVLLCMLMGITVQAQVFIEGNVYGGGNVADVDASTKVGTNVTIEKGAMGSVYGGGNQGSIYGTSTVNLKGGHIGYNLEKAESGIETTITYPSRDDESKGLEQKWYGVYGGCFGEGTIVSGVTNVNVGMASMVESVNVNGSVYGGGEMGQVGGGTVLQKWGAEEPTDFTTLRANGKLYWWKDVKPNRGLTKVNATDSYDPNKKYYVLNDPDYNQEHHVKVLSDNTNRVHVEGSVYGGGRGYTLLEDGSMYIPTDVAMVGAMYGSSLVEVGMQDLSENSIQIDGTAYYFGQADIQQCYYANISGIDKPIKWEKEIFVYDMNVNKFVKVDFKGTDIDLHDVMGVNNKAFLDYDIHSGYNPEVEYFERAGVVAVAGGGERGAIVGSKYGFDKKLEGGNTNVKIYSGTIGSVLADGNIEGEVYGGGLNAEVYGITNVLVDGQNVWIRDAVYGGGCKGAVKNFKRKNQNIESISTSVNFKQGWARNVYGGNNMVEMGKGCISKVLVGQGMSSNDVTLVSQSVYGGNAYSPHKGRTEVEIHKGRVGFVKAGKDIRKEGDAISQNYYAIEDGIRLISDATSGIVPIHDNELIYEGSVYGGGFGPNASVKRTNVTMTGGIVKTGVFGGGEIAPVAYTTGSEGDDANAIVYTNRNMMSDGTVLETEVKHTKLAEGVNSTEVLISGGQASMVFGGGRGFSNYLGDTKSPEPGAVFGNTKVVISGTAKIDTAYAYRQYAAGNVYGGGMEGIVYGSTDMSISGGEIACNVYGGGRGFGGSYEELMAESQNISHRSSMDAGALYKNSTVKMDAGKVGSSVYGGGEGWYAYTRLGGYANYDTTGTVRGIVKVDILGSSVIGEGQAGCYASLGDWDSRGVFGGGRMAAVWGYSDVSIYETADVANVYGGNDISGRVIGKGRPVSAGLGDDPNTTNVIEFSIAKDTTATYVKITGTPKIGRVFGGGNGNYIYYDRPEYAAMLATKPIQPSTYVDIKMNTAGSINAAFGGGNAANVDTSRVYVYGDKNNVGLVDTVFGGGNAATVETRAMVRMDMALTAENRINYLFGGNNKATMDIVPDICLLQGKVKNVYGGGNAGQMTASEIRKDIFNQDVEDLSTYILVNSDQVVVSGALYGGCNHAKVHHGTFVDVRNTSGMTKTDQTNFGIANLYGGNDISDTVEWARLDVNDGLVHNMFGGGNGKYNYFQSGDYYYVTNFDEKDFDGTNHIASRTHGRPYTKTTYVNVYGGQIKSNVYGGGNAGDCANTNLVVNDTIKKGDVISAENLAISGRVFGGGNGILENLCKVDGNVGNVKKLAKTDLYYVKTLENAYVYGGGNAGDVENTLLTVHPNWNQSLIALYGGCYGSNVWGTARTILNCDTIEGKDIFNIERVYGGNDFSGVVKNSVLTVNSGKYYNIFGAGNGRYVYTDNSVNPTGCTAPNSEMPTINFYEGKVYHNMYGGGDMGFVYKEATKTAASANIADYAHIEVNVHGGTFYSNIFAGGAGSAEAGAPQLVYGLKQLNMDGGYVRLSVYGGTENVTDGYPAECVSKETTTKRPSSVLNITGGVIDNHIYGGGYLGTVYGSIFVNIGKEAVNNSPIWTNTYKGHNYSAYKPEFVTDKKADTINHLMAQTCSLNASVYNGANWGDAGENYIFNTQGFYGGESHILIDGEGYNTSISGAGSSLPFMHIENSLIGAGTSCEGGDVWRLITVRNYGVYYSENNNCGAAKKLQSIQRADRLLLENVAIELEGEQDAYTAYPSPSYTINRVDTVMSKGGNVVVFDNSATNMAKLQFLNADGTVCEGNTLTNMKATLLDCTSGVTVCDKLGTVAMRPYTTFFIKNGVSIDVVKSTETTDTYGDVEGFAYYIADEGTQATISARYKTATVNNDDGGFFSACYKENKFGLSNNATLENQTEYPYQNFSEIYRVWRIGKGKRTRQVTILAHSDVTKLADDNKLMTVPYSYSEVSGGTTTTHEGNLNLALAKADLRLPPAGDGHYYKIEGGILVDEANGNEMNLLNTAWDPESWENPTGTTSAPGGEWKNIPGVTADTDPREIDRNPTHVFGLLMESGHAFTDACPTFTNAPTCNQYITISGNNHYNQTNGYLSQKVSGDAEIIPKLRFYLTYSTNFASTILRDITFTLKEYDAANNFVGDIDVTVTVATIIDKFIDDDLEVLAMYNEGRTDKFVRKFVLPASLQRRDLYLKDIQWEPCKENTMHAGATGTEKNFGLLGSDKCTDKTELKNTAFGIELVPNEDITNAVASTLGWYSIVTPSINIYDEADKYNGESAYAGKGRESYSALEGNTVKAIDLKKPTNNGGKGTYVGVLDGRSTAAIDVVLHYNGETIYDKGAGYIGRVILGFEYYNAGTKQGTFNLTIYVKTREHGDTIYMAPDATLTRDGITLNADPFTTVVENVTGKSPEKYVRTFDQAMANGVYQEGDVIAIMDKISIPTGTNIVIRGSDYSIIEVIRYSGAHYEFPGANCAYRGPLIEITGDGRFSAFNMVFNGSAVCKRKPWVDIRPNSGVVKERTLTDGTKKYVGTYTLYANDTMQAQAPIFVVKDNGTLTLSNKLYIQNNYNRYPYAANATTAVASPDEHLFGSAISLVGDATHHPKVVFHHNVEISNNIISAAQTIDNHNSSGAIYVKNGIVELGMARNQSSIQIVNNYYDKKADGTAMGKYWKDYMIGDKVARYAMDETVLKGLSQSNVYLTRTATAENSNMIDDISNVIQFKHEQSDVTRIGIRKWFPGPTERDTIQAVQYLEANPLMMERAFDRGLFLSDNKDYNIFYNSTINPYVIYLQRCASFKKQFYGNGEQGAPLYTDGLSTPILMKPVIDFKANLAQSCSTGEDTLIYNVHGGFYPYTYKWERAENENFSDAEVIKTSVSPYTNDQVNAEMYPTASNTIPKYDKAVESNSGIVLTKSAPMKASETEKSYFYRATATDLMGCSLTKTVEVLVKKSKDLHVDVTENNGTTDVTTQVDVPGVYFYQHGTSSHKDTINQEDITHNQEDITHMAKIERYFQGVHLIKRVVADGWGTVTGKMRYYDEDITISDAEFNNTLFCQGDRVEIKAEPKVDAQGKTHKFIMWDFDPYDEPITEFIIPKVELTITAYFGPDDYWKDEITTESLAKVGTDYVTHYNGDVDIYSENGLAWLISVVNGLNGQQARPFFFNTVRIHPKSQANEYGSDLNTYDMKDHLWTPVGSFENKFRGRFVVDDGVVIKNIFLNEPQMEYVGFFGHLDSARVSKLNLQSVMAHGSQYVGGLAAEAVQSKILGCSVTDNDNASAILSLITTNYTSGGLVAKGDQLEIGPYPATAGGTEISSVAKAKFLGSAIYSGGALGYGNNVKINSTSVRTDDRMTALYMGGIAGYTTGKSSVANAKAPIEGSYIANNYVHYTTFGNDQRVGGLVGFAKNTILENNYVYGEAQAQLVTGALGATLSSGVSINNCYYQEATAAQPFGINGTDNTPVNITTFNGSGNNVVMNDNVGGINNLTRVLNNWVREKNVDSTEFLTWRSDLDTVNHGYPIFGTPDIIPVYDTITQDACDRFEWNDIEYNESGNYSMNYVDSALCIDSTITLNLIIHNSTMNNFEDSVLVGESYNDYGFYISATETELLRETVESEGVAVLQLTDTLQTEFGCDSVVVLNLTVYKNDDTGIQEPLNLEIKVYPNPTVSDINVEATGLISVEVYDNVSRKIAYREVDTDKCRITLSNCATGAYYLRIRTEQGVAIRKVIKK